MTIQQLSNQFFGNRNTFGVNLEIQDGNLVLEDRLFPNRVALMGACSNTERNPDTPNEYLIPEFEPLPIQRAEDLTFYRNDDAENTPSEIVTAYYDAFEGGARTFEAVILTRAVMQLGGDVSETDTVIPVSTVYTNKVTRMLNTGAHPLGVNHASMIEHNGKVVALGGTRPDTPAEGDIEVVQQSDMNDSQTDYVAFTHSDGRVRGFWFNTGADPEPAALIAMVAGGTIGSASTEVDISGATTAAEVRDALAAAIHADEELNISAFAASSTEVGLESNDPGVDGNSWAVTEDISNGGTSSGMNSGANTPSITGTIWIYDPATNEWAEAVNALGYAMRIAVPVTQAGVLRSSATVINLLGGMSNLAVPTSSVDDVAIVTFAGASSDVIATVTTNSLSVGIGQAAWVQDGADWYVIGGRTGATLRDGVHAVNSGTFVVAAASDVLPEGLTHLGAYFEPVTQRLYIFGGLSASGAVSNTYAFNTNTMLMEAMTLGKMPAPVYGMAVAEINGAAYTFGGYNNAGAATTRIARFDPDSLTWSTRSNLILAGAGGGAVVVEDRIYYFDGTQGGKYNVGIGNLHEDIFEFPEASTLAGTPFYVQCEWEIMRVVGYTTVRARGRDTDALVVQRAQKTSLAVPHLDRPDVTHEPSVLFDQMSGAMNVMANNSRADYLIMPWRATADCPYLEDGRNFAYLAGFYASVKSGFDRTVIAVLPVHPPNQNPRVEYTRTQEAAWIDALTSFDRLNFEGIQTWKIGDGRTDNDGDGKPDTYALLYVRAGEIPTGTPPMDSADVELDSNDYPIDLGKHLVVVASYGFSNALPYRNKFPSATRGYMRSGHASFAGMLSVLPPTSGSTGASTRGYQPVRFLSLLQENELIGKGYVTAVRRENGVRWSNGFTFGYNVPGGRRTDWAFASSVRKAAALSRAVRRLLVGFIGSNVDRQVQTSMEVEINKIIQQFVANGVVGPRTTQQIVVPEGSGVMGYARVKLMIEIPGELMLIDMVTSAVNN